MRRVVAPGHLLALSAYELPPGQTQCPYHFHHGDDELLLVLRGRPTLRTAEGQRWLAPGDVVHFPRGHGGAHQVFNAANEEARYIMVGTSVSPEVVEYPDSGKLATVLRSEAHGGARLWTLHRGADVVDYLEGERPRSASPR